LLKSEVDLEHRVVLVRSAKGRSGEPAKTRRLAIPEALVEALREQMRNTEGPYVFERAHKCARDFDSTLRRAEIPKLDPLGRKLTIHSFRHTFATLMAECIGHNPFFLKKMLGHKRITTTQQYCNPAAPVRALPFDLESLRGGRKGWTQREKRLAAET
jgi:integrase